MLEKVHKSKLRVGDIILNEEKDHYYMIIDIKYTWIHNHKTFKLLFDTGNKQTFSYEEMQEYKQVLKVRDKKC